MIRTIFALLSTAITIYTILCFIRIILTWIPTLSYSKITRFLASICDPYLDLFKGIRWLVLGSFDFSSALALCLLGVASAMLTRFSYMGHFSIAALCSLIVDIAWNLASSILGLILLIFVIRLISMAIYKNEYNPVSPILQQLDYSITPLVHSIAKTFTGKRRTSYKNELIISTITLFVIQVIGTILFMNLSAIFNKIPF